MTLFFSIGPLYINKSQFCYPYFLLTSKGNFGVKALPQICQESIFGILMAPQINPWGQTFWPSLHELAGVPVGGKSSVCLICMKYSGLLCLAPNQTRSRMRGTEYGRTTATTICAHIIMQF